MGGIFDLLFNSFKIFINSDYILWIVAFLLIGFVIYIVKLFV